MFRNYFPARHFVKTAWRNVIRNKAYTFISVFGLSLGITAAMLIFTFVSYQLSFDNFHPNADRIYRIVSAYHYETTEYQTGVPQPLGAAFRNDFSFAEKTARVRTYNNAVILLPGEKEIKKFQADDGLAFAENEFFYIFNFPLLQGDKKTILKEPNTAIITEKIAKQYFGNEDAMGKLIRFVSGKHKVDFKITGILENIPANTDRKQQVYLSYSNLKDYEPNLARSDNWGSISSGMQCFVLLKPSISKAAVEKTFPSFIKKYYDGDDAKTAQLRLQPLSDIHFNADYDGYVNKKYLWALVFVGIFLIITASVNFINLATAQALNRGKEIGIRKVLGGFRAQLFWQFILETTLITVLAFVLAYGLAQLLLPYLNSLLKENLNIELFTQWQAPVFMLALMIVMIFLSGFYPGFIISGFQPITALKGKLSQKQIGGFSLRRVLVVTQFAISQMLIIGTIVIAMQMRFSKTADLGFNKDAIVLLRIPENDSLKMGALKARLSELPGTENISLCMEAPASANSSFTSVRYDNRDEDEPWEVNVKPADDKYIATFGLKLVAGRNLFSSDTAKEYLVNETFVHKLGMASAQDVIGKKLAVDGKAFTVAGVVKDFYNNSFREAIDPVAITTGYKSYRNCAVKINLQNAKSSLAAFQKIWNELYPDYLYSYQFLDERIAKFYELDNIMLGLIELFAGIAILIGCLGLYGLVSFMAVQKTKEIGVRKVLGAGIQNILWLFGKEFSRLVFIAFIIAAPVAWWLMNKYLQDFKFRIQIGVGVFVLAIGITLLIAIMTVGYRSLKAAMANPVKCLRTE
ncbi:ABC transporter permease [Parafilimonas sp.]|uniref:ABC transporter permease n=1 Tax=Parafilimonas sp. TaxID=1969739 RepID=UPI0039E6CA6D